MAVMSCSGTRLSAASMTKASCEPDSACGSGISSRFCTLTTQSVSDLEELVTGEGGEGDALMICRFLYIFFYAFV
jgi:hypothetical protein